MRVRRPPVTAGTLLITLLAVTVGGCVVRVTNPGGTTPDPNEPTAGTILVRIVNNTDQPLDPQIFVGLVADGVDALFDEANARTDLGVGNAGIILANSEDAISVDCTEPVYVATQGGIFGDDLSAPIGTGRETTLEQGRTLQCGDLLVFTFSRQGDALITSVTVTPQN